MSDVQLLHDFIDYLLCRPERLEFINREVFTFYLSIKQDLQHRRRTKIQTFVPLKSNGQNTLAEYKKMCYNVLCSEWILPLTMTDFQTACWLAFYHQKEPEEVAKERSKREHQQELTRWLDLGFAEDFFLTKTCCERCSQDPRWFCPKPTMSLNNALAAGYEMEEKGQLTDLVRHPSELTLADFVANKQKQKKKKRE